MIFITHDLAVISQLADDIVVMKNGEVVEAATANALFRSPQHPYTQSLIAAIPDSAKPKNRHAIEVNAGDEIKANAAATPLVEVKGLSKSYSLTQNTWFFSKKREFKAVDNVSFDIFKGEILGLVGESGSGKSTLGRSVIRLLDADANVLRIDNTDLQSLGADDLRRARKNLQMIFQDPFASLNPRFTVFDTLAEPLLVHGIANKNNLLQKINELLDDVGLERKHIRKYPHEFSGGQRQRIAIARALAPQPKLIIADEPVSALDVTIQAQILELLLELTQKHGLTMLFISHDLSVVRYLCDRVMVMNKGQIVEQGETEALFSSPKNSYTQQLLSAIPTLKVSA